jgi:hypothetical protein
MLLSMSEILGLKIRADTVVLSACNNGRSGSFFSSFRPRVRATLRLTA